MTSSTIRWHLAPDSVGLEMLREAFDHGKRIPIKEAPHRSIQRVILGDLDVYVKHYREGRSRLLCGTRANREYDLTREVASRGVPVPEALAWGEAADGSYLVTRTLTETDSLLDVLAEPLPPALRFEIARALGAFLARAHATGVRHDDLHPGNVLIRVGQAFQPDASCVAGPIVREAACIGGASGVLSHGRACDGQRRQAGKPDLPHVQLFLIDLDAVRLSPPLSWPVARDNLLVLNRWFTLRFSHADRFRGWRSYSREAEFADDKDRARDLEQRTARSLLRFVAGLDGRCLGGNRHFRRFFAPGVRGHAVTGIDLAGLLANTDRVVDSAETLKRSRSSAVVGVSAKVEGEDRQAILKRVDATKWSDPLASLFRPPPALHAYHMAHALRLRGLPTPRPLAVWHRRRFGLMTDGYLLLERLPGAVTLDQFVETLDRSREARIRATEVSGQLARLLARMHRWNLSHRDLKAANVLISPLGWTMGQRGLCEAQVDGKDHVWLVDLAGVRLWHELSNDRKMRDLVRLNLSFLPCPELSRTRRLRFLLDYLGRNAKDWKSWWIGIGERTEVKAARIQNRHRSRG